jgi:hypothetical protein
LADATIRKNKEVTIEMFDIATNKVPKVDHILSHVSSNSLVWLSQDVRMNVVTYEQLVPPFLGSLSLGELTGLINSQSVPTPINYTFSRLQV